MRWEGGAIWFVPPAAHMQLLPLCMLLLLLLSAYEDPKGWVDGWVRLATAISKVRGEKGVGGEGGERGEEGGQGAKKGKRGQRGRGGRGGKEGEGEEGAKRGEGGGGVGSSAHF